MPLVGLIAAVGIPAGCALYLGYIAVTYPERLEYLWGWIGGKLGTTGSRMARNALGRRMDAVINDFAASAMFNLEHIEPAGVRTKWAESESEVRAALAADGDVVIYLQQDLPDGENLARAALAFVGRQFIPRAKLSLTARQRQSLDLYVTGQLLDSQRSLVADDFFGTVLQPLIHADEKLSGLVESLRDIDRKGYFYPILIQQLVFMGEKVATGVAKEQVHEEVSGFVSWLRARALRIDKDDTVPLHFSGTLISCGIVMVAKWEKALSGDASAFANSGVRYANNGFENVYVIGDTDYSRLIEETVAAIETRTRMIVTVDTTYLAGHRLADGHWVKDKTRLVLLRSANVQRYVDAPGHAVTESELR
ncbi:MAG: hypothetical protein ACYC6C_09010 [Coriobacteriia bacterium]